MNTIIHEANAGTEAVAIVGMSGRFPGAKNIEQFWANLRNGVESISFFSEQELNSAGVDPTVLKNPSYIRAKAIIEDIDLLDASFFGLTPREAKTMDPQHRLFLECAWMALEHAGYSADTYNGSIGVYAGSSVSTYLLYNLYSNSDVMQAADIYQTIFGNDKDFLATRVSYKLGLEGPSITVQTACSTSLVAVHLACQGLLNFECDMALAGGVSISVPQKIGYLYQEEGIASPDGHCRAFDARARGTVSGSGVGVVVLKRLSDALAEGDSICAVIQGSAINNDGSTKIGYTAPSVDGQAKVITEALALAEIEPETISYIEAHGTGTVLGDPIEIEALTRVFRENTDGERFCAIGSVKTNIGHLDAAAGIAGLIKTTLALMHKYIPPSLHFEQPNPKIDLAHGPFYVNTTLREWRAGNTPRRAGVSSFGIGGTNAHIVLEEAPPVGETVSLRKNHLLVLSAKTAPALETATTNLINYLKAHPDLNIADIAYTLQLGRKTFDHKRVLICQNLPDAIQALETMDDLTHFQLPATRPVVFMFPGQGAQYVNMARGLYQREEQFCEQVDLCCSLLQPHLGFDLREILFPDEHQVEDASQRLNETAFTQPALFVIEYSLAKLLMEWGIHPDAMLGHSLGEYVAACLAGVFSLTDALFLISVRGRMMQALPEGSMLIVPLPQGKIMPLLDSQLELAAVNGSSLCVVSGHTASIDRLKQRLAAENVDCRFLKTSHAFHSQMMDPILEPFLEQIKSVELNVPSIPFLSNTTGTWISSAEATDPEYWMRHLRQTVRFAENLQELLKEPGQVFVEVGPGNTISSLVRHFREEAREQTILSTLQNRESDYDEEEVFLLKTVGLLWFAGIQVNWLGLYKDKQPRRIPLPAYPFERQSYWIEPLGRTQNSPVHQESMSHENNRRAHWFYFPAWKQSVLPALEAVKQEDLKEQKGCWLVFVDQCKLGVHMVSQMRSMGQNVITISPGTHFSRVAMYDYIINPKQSDDYTRVLMEMRQQGNIPNTIVHLWSITPGDVTSTDLSTFEQAQYLGFYSLLFLAQSLAKQNITSAVNIFVISTNIHNVTGKEIVQPEKSTLLGACKVIPQEYRNITCRSIDLGKSELEDISINNTIQHLINEFNTVQPDLIVAYKGSRRWVQILEPVQLKNTTGQRKKLREGGVYLITGGLGNIGLTLVEHIAKNVPATFILVGRSTFPHRKEWEQWVVTHEEQDTISQKIRRIQTIENAGSQVLIFSANVADQNQMQAILTEIVQRFGAIHGVIHAAGSINTNTFRTIHDIDICDCEEQFEAKVYGTLVLNSILREYDLDFCLLQSSLSSILGGLGFIAYAAANIFMDTLVSSNDDSAPFVWRSINWDGWEFNREQDMSARMFSQEASITPEAGLEAFDLILTNDMLPQIIVSRADLHQRMSQWIYFTSSQEEKKKPSSKHLRPDLPNAYVAPRTDIEQTICDIWQQLLGIEMVGIYDDFFALGGHSLLGTQFITRLRDIYQINLPLHILFEESTAAKLAIAITQRKAELVDNELLAQALEEIDQLSDSDVQSLLREEVN